MAELKFDTRFNIGDTIIPFDNPFDEQLGEVISYKAKTVIDVKDVPNGQ